MKIFKKAKRGFTLVELVVVIAVIAILAAVSVGAYFGVTESANKSRLEQEAKQMHTAIQTVALGTNSNQSLGNDGLRVDNLVTFERALKDTTGSELKVVNQEDFTVHVPTIYLVETLTSNQNTDTLYKGFEYYNSTIGGKKAVVNVVTGDVDVVNTDKQFDPNDNMRSYYFIDREWWHQDGRETYLYAFGDNSTQNANFPGEKATLVETVVYEEESLNVYSFDVDASKYHTIIWSSYKGESKVCETANITLASLGNNDLVITTADEETTLFTPTSSTYVPGKADYGQFPEPNNQTYYFIDQDWWNVGEKQTKVYLFNKATANNPPWITSFKDVTLVETIATEGHGNSNVYSITIDVDKWDAFILVNLDADGAVVAQTVDILLSDLGANNIAVLTTAEVPTGGAKAAISGDTYVTGKWDYGQYTVEPNNVTYYFVDQYFWRNYDNYKLYIYAFNSETNEENSEFPGVASIINPTTIATGEADYGDVNITQFTVDLNSYDTIVLSSVSEGESNTKNIQTVDIPLDQTNNLFALNDLKEGEKYTVVSTVFAQNTWNYGQTMRVLNPEDNFDPETYTIYFENNWQWPSVTVQYWDDEENTLSYTIDSDPVGRNNQGYAIYQIDLPNDVEKVQFSGQGGYGTDISTEFAPEAGLCYYMIYDESTNTKPCESYEGFVPQERYTLTITTNPADATVVLTAPGETQNEGENSITVFGGQNVSYNVSKEGYRTKTATETINESKELSITLLESSSSRPDPGKTILLRGQGFEGATWGDDSIAFEYQDDGTTYLTEEIVLTTASQFKFTIGNEWKDINSISNYCPFKNKISGSSGNNMKVTEAGSYIFAFDNDSGYFFAYKVGSESKISIIGDAVEDWATDTDLSTTDNIHYSGTVDLKAEKEFKLRFNNAWDYGFGFGCLTYEIQSNFTCVDQGNLYGSNIKTKAELLDCTIEFNIITCKINIL